METNLTVQQLHQFVASGGYRNPIGEDSHAAIEHLGRLLESTDTREEAKTALLALAVFDAYEYTSYWENRVEAWKQLKPVLGDPDVIAVFQRIATSDSRLPLRCQARNYIDNLQGLEHTLRVEVVDRMISSLDLDNPASAYALNYILWTEKSVAAEALSKIGSSAFAERVLSKFNTLRRAEEGKSSSPIKDSMECHGLTPCGGFSLRFNPSAVYYSILRFSRLHSSDLSPPVISRLAAIRESTNELKERIYFGGRESDESLFHGANQEKEWNESKKREVASLVDIISSGATPDYLKIVAIRNCGKYFFTQQEYGWVQHEYKEYASLLYPHIERLLEHPEKKVRDEAIFFTTLCKQHKE